MFGIRSRSAYRTLASLIFILTACVLTVGAPLSRTAAAQSAAISMTKIATQPEAAIGLTGYNGDTWSSSIHAIAFDGNSLIAGYGDYNFNSDSNGGPNARTGIQPLDLTTKQWGTLLNTGTESNDVFRTIGGHLYTPTTDPSAHSPAGGGWATNASGSWQAVFPSDLSGTEHVMDIASFDGGVHDLWVSGAMNRPGWGPGEGQATLWHSTDGGQTWQVALIDLSQPAANSTGYERYYWIGIIGDKLYVQANSTEPNTPMRIYDNTTGTWSSSPYQANCDTTQQLKVSMFDNQIICNGDYTSGGFYTYDGTLHVQKVGDSANSAPQAMAVDGGQLYVLMSDGALYRTASFAQPWQKLGVVSSQGVDEPSYISAIGVHNGYLYVGDANADIWQSDALLPAPSVTAGTVTNNDCLADTGANTGEFIAIAVALLFGGLAVFVIARKSGGSKRALLIVALVAGGFALVTPFHRAYADACGAGQTASSSVGISMVAAGTTLGDQSTMQVYSVLAGGTPSSGATLMAQSLQLSLVDTPVAGSTVSPDGLTVTVPGEGVYVADTTNGTIYFTPAAGFAGTGKGVRFTVGDTKGQSASNTYTPSVVEVIALPTVTFALTNTSGTYSLSGPATQPVAADTIDAFTSAVLSPAHQALVASHLTFDPSAQTLQQTADRTSSDGFKVEYNPTTDTLTFVITDQNAFNDFASLSCGSTDVAFTITQVSPLGVATWSEGSVRLTGTSGSCGSV